MTSTAEDSETAMNQPHRSVQVSAPGRILLSGGYLVLERRNPGWVIAANQRCYTTVETGPPSSNIIVVDSPQLHAQWTYEFDPSNSNVQPSLQSTSIDDFVEKTLRVCFLYLLQESHPPNLSLKITIQADNSFYSVLPHLEATGAERTLEAVQSLGKFLPVPKDAEGKAIIHRTGLGSSAALTTSLVGALVHYFRPSLAAGHQTPFTAQKVSEQIRRANSMDTYETEEEDDEVEEEDIGSIIHNLAQICHCQAQGKVGSGVDVSAACYGTQVYQRFPKCMLPDLLNQLDHEASMGGTNAQSTLDLLVAHTNPWASNMVTPIFLPKGNLQVLMAHVQGESDARPSAKTILKWKQSKAISPPIPHWGELQQLNRKVVDIMTQISQQHDAVDYDALAHSRASEWPTESPLFDLHETFLKIRKHLKGMGEDAGVPIEPDEQSRLCEATSELPGVVTCLVPGAGGVGAVACLYVDRPWVKEAIGLLWASWEDPRVCPLDVQASDEGLRVETMKS